MGNSLPLLEVEVEVFSQIIVEMIVAYIVYPRIRFPFDELIATILKTFYHAIRLLVADACI